MKILKIVFALLFSFAFSQAPAQSDVSKGLKKGLIVLHDGSSLSGYIKDNMKSNASVSFFTEQGGKKKKYNADELAAVEIEQAKFICVQGDFFKVISAGELNYLQKASNAPGKVSYNGNEPIFLSGTEGSVNDYFMYDNKDKQLRLVSKKNFAEVVKTSFAGNTAAMSKAQTLNGDLVQLKDAVEIFNSNK